MPCLTSTHNLRIDHDMTDRFKIPAFGEKISQLAIGAQHVPIAPRTATRLILYDGQEL